MLDVIMVYNIINDLPIMTAKKKMACVHELCQKHKVLLSDLILYSYHRNLDYHNDDSNTLRGEY